MPSCRYASAGAKGAGERQPLFRCTAPNEVWSMDFVFDRTAEGRVMKCRTVVDDAKHEVFVTEVERTISSMGVKCVMDRLARASEGDP